MLGFAIFFIDIICGINAVILIQKVNNYKQKILILCVLIIFILLSSIPGFKSIEKHFENANQEDDKKYEEYIKNEEVLSHFSINREYLPVNAIKKQNTYMLNRKEKTYILQGRADIIEQKKDGLSMEIQVEYAEKNTILEFPYLFYPGYEITLESDGKIKKLVSEESENGIENTKITIKYEVTTITKISYVISFFTLIGFIIYVVTQKRGENEK